MSMVLSGLKTSEILRISLLSTLIYVLVRLADITLPLVLEVLSHLRRKTGTFMIRRNGINYQYVQWNHLLMGDLLILKPGEPTPEDAILIYPEEEPLHVKSPEYGNMVDSSTMLPYLK